MNDQERENWINNDEHLYRWWKASKQSMRAFIKINRNTLTLYIFKQLGLTS